MYSQELTIAFDDVQKMYSFAEWLQEEGINAFSKSTFNKFDLSHICGFDVFNPDSDEEPDTINYIEVQ